MTKQQQIEKIENMIEWMEAHGRAIKEREGQRVRDADRRGQTKTTLNDRFKADHWELREWYMNVDLGALATLHLALAILEEPEKRRWAGGKK